MPFDQLAGIRRVHGHDAILPLIPVNFSQDDVMAQESVLEDGSFFVCRSGSARLLWELRRERRSLTRSNPHACRSTGLAAVSFTKEGGTLRRESLSFGTEIPV